MAAHSTTRALFGSYNGPLYQVMRQSDGKTLELTSKSTFSGPNGEMTLSSSEKLQLSADGKMLTVNTHRESPRGPQDSTLVFNK